jgi:hypothetical protein
MRRTIALLSTGFLLVGCSTISDNVSVDMDGIIAATCENFAEQLTRQIEIQLTTITDQVDVDLPDIDVQGAINRAEDLGCSPDDMRSLIEDNLDTITTTSEKAQQLLEDLQDQAGSP